MQHVRGLSIINSSGKIIHYVDKHITGTSTRKGVGTERTFEVFRHLEMALQCCLGLIFVSAWCSTPQIDTWSISYLVISLFTTSVKCSHKLTGCSHSSGGTLLKIDVVTLSASTPTLCGGMHHTERKIAPNPSVFRLRKKLSNRTEINFCLLVLVVCVCECTIVTKLYRGSLLYVLSAFQVCG